MATFGFSVGVFLAGAELAIQLSKALSDSSGAGREYREFMAKLNVIHKVLLQVDQLSTSNKLGIPTMNAIAFATKSVNQKMTSFLEESERCYQSLKLGGSGNAVKDTLNKGRWAICMPEKVRQKMIESCCRVILTSDA